MEHCEGGLEQRCCKLSGGAKKNLNMFYRYVPDGKGNLYGRPK